MIRRKTGNYKALHYGLFPDGGVYWNLICWIGEQDVIGSIARLIGRPTCFWADHRPFVAKKIEEFFRVENAKVSCQNNRFVETGHLVVVNICRDDSEFGGQG